MKKQYKQKILWLLGVLVFYHPLFAQIIPSNGNYGLFTETASNTTAGNATQDVEIGIYTWEKTLVGIEDETPFEGTEVLSYQQASGTGWFGMGFSALAGNYNLAAFSCDGYLHFEMKTTTTADFEIKMESPGGSVGFVFSSGADPYDFVRDGQWHSVEIPIADFIAKGLDETNVSIPFIFSGGNVNCGPVSFDNIYLGGGREFTDPCLAQELTAIGFESGNDAKAGVPFDLSTVGYNQFNVPMSGISFSYSVNNGASIDQNGILSTNSIGLYTVTVSATNSNGETITTEKVIAVHNEIPENTMYPENGNYGIYAENPASTTAGKLAIGNDTTGAIYIWEGTMKAVPTTPSEGSDVISYTSTGIGWMGMGIHAQTPVNISAFSCSDGTLSFDIKTDQTNDFSIKMGSEGGIIAEVLFSNSAGSYGLVRNGNWQTIQIPLSDFVGLDYTSVTELFQFTCASDMPGEIAFDNIYLTNGHAWTDPCLDGTLTTIGVISTNYITNVEIGQQVDLLATGYNQYQAPMSELVYTWTSDGGTINQSGQFLANEEGLYTITASTANKNGETITGLRSIAVYNTLPESILIPTTGNYGIFAENPANNTAGKLNLDNENAGIYVWSETMKPAKTVASEGTDVISYKSDGKGWLGMGIHTDTPMNISAFTCSDGSLHFDMKTDQTNNFTIRMGNADEHIAEIAFNNGADPYGFVRDGNWHSIDIPLSDFVGVDLTNVTELFQFLCASDITGEIAFDNIYLKNGHDWNDPCLNAKLSDIDVKSFDGLTNIETGQQIGLSAEGFTQYGLDVTGITYTWSVNNGGTINQAGEFSATNEGLYTITASAVNKDGETVTGTRAIAVYETLPVNVAIPTEGNYGIFAEDPAKNTAGRTDIDGNAHIYIWENTMKPAASEASEGSDVLCYKSGGKGWLGMGIHLDSPMNISAFSCDDSYLHFDMKTDQTNNFTIRMGSENGTIAEIAFNYGSDPYGFVRDGNWHSLDIPLSDFVGIDLTSVTELFQFLCASDIIGTISFDNIYLKNGHNWNHPCLDGKLSVVEVTAPRYKTLTNKPVQLSAKALSQYAVEYPDTEITWSVNNGGSITQDGLFTASVNQDYIITASTVNEYGDPVSGSVIITITDSIPAYVDGRHIFINKGERYIIKGVCYDPRAIGTNQRSFAQLDTDIALMKEAGINTVRTYSPITETNVLDELFANGIRVIMGFTSSSGGYDISSGLYLDYINQFKNHPAILMWDLGNEYNYHPEWFGNNINNWYKMLNDAAAAIHEIDYDHPVSTTHGELPAADVMIKCPNVDVWGMNVYRSNQSYTAITDFAAVYNKPCYLAETGGDSYNSNPDHTKYTFGENQQMQADANGAIIKGVLENLDAGSGVAIFQFVDAWWKDGSWSTQDPGGWAPNSFGVPFDGAPNEEYWGIVDMYRNKKITFDTVKYYFAGEHCIVKAKAGQDQLLPEGTASTILSGSASTYPISDVTYQWVQTAGAPVSISNPNSAVTTISGLVSGNSYSFELSVGGACQSAIDNINIQVESTSDLPPVALAGGDQVLTYETTTAILDGSQSYDPENLALSYTWTQTSGIAATISDINSVNPTVSDLISGESYSFQLVVNDGNNESQPDEVEIIIDETPCIPANIALGKPATSSTVEGVYIANSAVDGNLSTRSSTLFSVPQWLKIDLGQSIDIENVILVWERASAESYYIMISDEDTEPNPATWTIISSQTGMEDAARTDTLTNLSGKGKYIAMYATNKLHPWGISLYEFEVYAPCGSILNEAPVADAGINQNLSAGTTSTTLDGSASYDPDNAPSPLTYQWSQVAGESVTISDINNVTPNITGLTDGNSYTFELSVSDDEATSASSTVIVSVESVGNNCEFSAANGDFSATIGNSDNPTVTFIPETPITGCDWVILTAFVDGSIIGAWYMTEDGSNFTSNINVPIGTDLEIYFTYGIPGGGQRDSNGDRMSVIVGNCDTYKSKEVTSSINLKSETMVNIYPNPSIGEIFVKASGYNNNEELHINIFDLSGKSVYQKEIFSDCNGNLNSQQIIDNDINQGVYFISITGNTSTICKKIIVK